MKLDTQLNCDGVRCKQQYPTEIHINLLSLIDQSEYQKWLFRSIESEQTLTQNRNKPVKIVMNYGAHNGSR